MEGIMTGAARDAPHAARAVILALRQVVGQVVGTRHG